MFSFFKRKKNLPATEVADQRLPETPEAQAAPETVPQAGVPDTPVQDAVAPVALLHEGLEPEPVKEVMPAEPDISAAKASATDGRSPASGPQASPASEPAPATEILHADPAVSQRVSTPPEPEQTGHVAQESPPPKRSWLARLKEGLSRTGQTLGSLFVGVKVDENLFEELETALIMADAGLEATEKLLTALRARVRKERLEDPAKVKAALRDILADHLAPLEKQFPLGSARPLVVMIAGVNGAGKTTSIGKLANHFQAQGAKVLLAAGDTFRAAAREQLMEWGARNNVTVIAQEGGDPAAVAFDAVNAGRARGRRRDGRYGGSPAHAIASYGRTQENQAGHWQGRRRRTPRSLAGGRWQHGPECHCPDQSLRCRHQADRSGCDQARRHCQGRYAGGGGGRQSRRASGARVLDRCGRGAE